MESFFSVRSRLNATCSEACPGHHLSSRNTQELTGFCLLLHSLLHPTYYLVPLLEFGFLKLETGFVWSQHGPQHLA